MDEIITLLDNLRFGGSLPNSVVETATEIWHSLVIEFTRAELRYICASNPAYVFRVPLRSAEDRAQAEHCNERFVKWFRILLVHDCIRNIVWRFTSALPADVDLSDSCHLFMRTAMFVPLTHFELDVANTSDRLPFDIAEDLPMRAYASMSLILRQGDFHDCGAALQILKAFVRVDWWAKLRLHVEISRLSAMGRETIERADRALSSVTIARLKDKKMLDHVAHLIRFTESYFEIKITSYELPGESELHLARGNLSLCIGSISRKSRILLSCDEELDKLTLSLIAAKRITTTGVSIGELQVNDESSKVDT